MISTMDGHQRGRGEERGRVCTRGDVQGRRGGGGGGRARPRHVISSEIQANVMDHVLVCGMAVMGAGQ